MTHAVLTTTPTQMLREVHHIGRFAPSPTGPLHFGSLVAAVGSWLDARSHAGSWLVRIEDVDGPRTQPGAETAILRALERFGLRWDGAILRQSARSDAYESALARLRAEGHAFACGCTRREIADSVLPGAGQPGVYPGTCRAGLPPGRVARAWRMRVGSAVIAFDDAVQGRCEQSLATAVGDFVIHRADGPFAYQLAVVVDDAAQGVTSVVRGADLLDSTPRQILLQRALGLPTPAYAHLPVATNAAGEKLSKQTLAADLAGLQVSATLHAALAFLGHTPPATIAGAPADELLCWALAHWEITRVPGRHAQPAPPACSN